MIIDGGDEMRISIKKLDNTNRNQTSNLLKLWNENCIEITNHELLETDIKAINGLVNNYILSEYGIISIAEDDRGKVIGYGLASISNHLVTSSYYGQIDEIYVSPSYRRNGIGKNITEYLLDWLRMKEVSVIYIFVDPENKPAQDFWRNTGFSNEFIVMTSHVS